MLLLLEKIDLPLNNPTMVDLPKITNQPTIFIRLEYMCFIREEVIFLASGGALKFMYLGSCVSSTERDLDIRLAKVWTAFDRLSIIWKSDLFDKIKREFFQPVAV